MERTYTVVLLHERDGRYSAIIPALECASWGRTVPEALRNIEEAARCHIESLEAHGDPVPDDVQVITMDMGDATEAVVYRNVVVADEAKEPVTLA